MKAGFVGFGEVNTPAEIIVRKCAAAEAALKKEGISLVSVYPVTDDYEENDIRHALSVLKSDDFDFLILCVAGWIPTHAVIKITEHFRHKPKDFYGDLMRYYHEDDSVRCKVVRAVPTVDEVNGELVGSLWVDTDAPLTAEEQAVFCAYISGQYSDGWGEGFEQREIDVGDGKLYVHFWQDHDFELKRDVPDMTEFKKLLNRPKKPKMQLIGQDGNIFAIMGRASRLLKNSGQGEKAKEMRDRVMSCDNYQKALNIISEYVETELTPSPTPKHDRGDAR